MATARLSSTTGEFVRRAGRGSRSLPSPAGRRGRATVFGLGRRSAQPARGPIPPRAEARRRRVGSGRLAARSWSSPYPSLKRERRRQGPRRVAPAGRGRLGRSGRSRDRRTARSVSATCASNDSDGWQHRNPQSKPRVRAVTCGHAIGFGAAPSSAQRSRRRGRRRRAGSTLDDRPHLDRPPSRAAGILAASAIADLCPIAGDVVEERGTAEERIQMFA